MFAQFIGASTAGATVGSTTYCIVSGISSWNATEAARQQVIPHALTIDRLRIKVATAPGAGKNIVGVIRKNGVDTGVTCTISGTNTTAQDLSNSVAFAAGDLIDIKFTVDAGAAASGATFWTLRQSATSQYAVLCGSSGAGTATTYFPFGAMGVRNATVTNLAVAMAHGGTIKNLYASQQAANGTGNSWALALAKNGADQTLTATVADAALTANDTTHTVSVVAGDRIAIHATAAGVPANTMVSVSFTVVPTNDGDATLFHADQNALATGTGANQYHFGGGVNPNQGWVTTENTRQLMLQACTLKEMYLRQDNGPGNNSTNAWIVAFRKNGVDTALTITVNSNAATSQSITGQSISIADDDLASYGATFTGTPFGLNPQTGILYTMATATNATVTAPPALATAAVVAPVIVDSVSPPAAAAIASAPAPSLQASSLGGVDITVRL